VAASVRILLVDEHAHVRQALRSRLDSAPGLEVVGDVADAETALQLVRALHPELVVIETKRSDGRGLELISWIAQSGLGSVVVVLTSYPSDWERWAAHRAGAVHYLLKDIDTSQLLEHLRDAARLFPYHAASTSTREMG
jgi:DNA-binding NarL/FixJ family response regulator